MGYSLLLREVISLARDACNGQRELGVAILLMVESSVLDL